MKQSPGPWDDIIDPMRWMTISGERSRKLRISAYLPSPEGRPDGLVHISELDSDKVKEPQDVVHVGDVFKMRVIKIDREQRRLGLSIRAYVESTGEDPVVSRAPQPVEPPEEESAPSGEVAEEAVDGVAEEVEGEPEAEVVAEAEPEAAETEPEVETVAEAATEAGEQTE